MKKTDLSQHINEVAQVADLGAQVRRTLENEQEEGYRDLIARLSSLPGAIIGSSGTGESRTITVNNTDARKALGNGIMHIYTALLKDKQLLEQQGAQPNFFLEQKIEYGEHNIKIGFYHPGKLITVSAIVRRYPDLPDFYCSQINISPKLGRRTIASPN